MTKSITMRELQKISASAIAALPHVVPVRSDGQTVAFLVPLKKAPPDLLQRAAELSEQELAARTPGQQAVYDEYLREIGEE